MSTQLTVGRVTFTAYPRTAWVTTAEERRSAMRRQIPVQATSPRRSNVRKQEPEQPIFSRFGEPLTVRETEILVEIGLALTNVQIGKKLGITQNTVKRHASTILEKLGLDNRVAMALYAVRKGLVAA